MLGLPWWEVGAVHITCQLHVVCWTFSCLTAIRVNLACSMYLPAMCVNVTCYDWRVQIDGHALSAMTASLLGARTVERPSCLPLA